VGAAAPRLSYGEGTYICYKKSGQDKIYDRSFLMTQENDSSAQWCEALPKDVYISDAYDWEGKVKYSASANSEAIQAS